MANKKATNKKQTSKNGKTDELSPKWRKRVLIGTWVIVFTPLLLILTLLLLIPGEEIPDYKLLENPVSNEASTVYSSNEKVLGTFYVDNRTNIDYHELPQSLIDALVATEDERYFEHSGIDGWGLMRAVAGQAMGKNKGGGSTISQQLAKMMFHQMPSRDKWGRINEKLAEWVIAARIEKRYTKKEIIAMYFNQFNFLYTAVGIKSAARVYFNKDVNELTIPESAVLVGMAKSPTIYNPKRNPENAKKRRNTVLGQMKKNGYITQEQYDQYSAEEIVLDFNPETQNTGIGPYVRAYVKERTQEILKENNLLDPNGNSYNIYRDGLKIYTAIDYNMQKHAEKAVEKHLKGYLQPEFDKDNKRFRNAPFDDNTSKAQQNRIIERAIKQTDLYKNLKKQGKSDAEIDKVFNTKISMTVFDWKGKNFEKKVQMSPSDSILNAKKILRAGLVSMDPKTGMVKAWVGGPNYKYFKYDCAYRAKRQIGSTMKPFVYGMAIEHGVITACTTCPNVEYCLDVQNGSEIKQWCPKGSNFDGLPIPMFYCLAASKNPCTAWVIKQSGGDNRWVIDFFDKIGLRNNSMEAVPTLGLGTCDLSPLEITSAHCVFSNHGIYNQPIVIVRIEDRDGRVLYDVAPKMIAAMNPEAAFEVLKMMKGALGTTNPYNGTGKKAGTAQRLRWDDKYGGFKNPIAGKTGTTQSSSDGWFIGHTPDLVTGIWVGNEDRSIHFKSGNIGQGARMAMPIWGYYMKALYRDSKVKISKKDFEPPVLGAPTNIACEINQTPDNLW